MRLPSTEFRPALDWRGRGSLHEARDGTRTWAAGYAFVDGDATRVLQDAEIAQYLASHGDMARVAAGLDGCYAAVVARDETVWLVSDRYGSVPLYVPAVAGTPLVVADSPWPIVAAASDAPALDDVAVLDILRLGYVAGDRTLLDGIHTIAPAAVVRVERGRATTQRYWHLRYVDSGEPFAVYEQRLAAAFEGLARRIDALCADQDREAVLMLSGGLDTRSLAALLASRSRSRVRCVSYGAADDPDVVAARGIADAAGFAFDHRAVPYAALDDEFFRQAVREVGATTRFTCGTGARIAPLPSDGVVLTGHTGFLSSDFAIMNWGVRDKRDVRRMVYARHYMYERADQVVRDAVRIDYDARKYVSLDETLVHFDESSDPLSEMHRWNEEHRQRKLVLMEYRAYEQRARWMMPLGAYDVVDVFCSLPWELRLDQALYKQTMQRLCAGPAAALATISRVGGRLDVSDGSLHRYRRVRALQPVSGAVLTRALPAVKRYSGRQRRRAPLRYGPAPLWHWFLTDGAARTDLLERVDAINVDVLRPDGVRAAMLDPRSGEWVFQLLVAGALTVQGVADEAARVWRESRTR